MTTDDASNPPPLPARPAEGHKGTFGTVCVVGGRARPPRVMIGGPALSTLAALRVGAGLAVLAMPEPILAAGLTIAPSATGLALPVDRHGSIKPSDAAEILDTHLLSFRCVAVGPGLGHDEPERQAVIRLVNQTDVPLVIDADALNALAAAAEFHGDLRADAVLTPHPGEFARLAESLGMRFDPNDDAARADAATEMAGRLGCVVVLKGRRTVVSNGLESWTNTTGNPSLATAGTGDVLTGVIAGLVAQFAAPHLGAGSRQITPEQRGRLSLYDCARIGVKLHGHAADLWAAEHGAAGLLATDLIDRLPRAMSNLPRRARDRASFA